MPGRRALPALTAAGAGAGAGAGVGGCEFPPGIQSSFGEATDPRASTEQIRCEATEGNPFRFALSRTQHRGCANHFIDQYLHNEPTAKYLIPGAR